jgi:DNA transposition AAA+ family ATPase
MKKIFVRTKNVKNFIALTDKLINRKDGVPRMGLIYGEPGLGKTQTAVWWSTKNDAIYVRASNNMSSRWLLQEIVEELGESPCHSTADLMKQCVGKLKMFPRIIVVDEIDYLTCHLRVIETLRDLHDKTGVPVILIGMAMADKKLTRYKHLYDRISEKVMFEVFSQEDVKAIVNELSEIKITDDAIEIILSKINRFRQLVKLISTLEEIATTNNFEQIDGKIIKGVLNG